MRERATGAGERGFALVAALWLVAAASFVLAAGAAESRPERHLAANARESVRAGAAARAGVARALAWLRARQRDGDEEPDRGPAGEDDLSLLLAGERDRAPGLDTARLGDTGSFRVRLRDLGARLPLNTADVGELRRLMQATGASFAESTRAAQSIADWRDPDGLHRPQGAEWDDHYRHLEPPIRPRNGPFPSLEELRRVRGVDADRFRRVAPYLTVRSDGPVNVNTAPEPVLEALAGVDRVAVAVLLRRRRLGRPVRSLEELAALLPSAAEARLRRRWASLSRTLSFEPERIVVRSVGRAEGSPARAVVEALAVLQRDGVELGWRVQR